MILTFSLGNFRSFHEIQTIDFRATGLVSEDKEVDNNNITMVADSPVLKTVGVYGPNGSGKTNLIKGLEFFKSMVKNSLGSEGLLKDKFSPFVLSSDVQNNKGYFQINMLIDKKKYRYGFTLKNQNGIAEEWLFGPADKNETFYFKRHGQKIEFNKERFSEGDSLPLEKLRQDTLFLTFVSSYNGETSNKIREFISNKAIFENENLIISQYRVFNDDYNLTNLLIKSGNKSTILKWLQNAGLFFEDVRIANTGEGSPFSLVMLSKKVFNSKGEVTGTYELWIDENESSGTRKFYSYIGQLHKLFTEGGILVVDEIDSNFHPSLLLKLISFFNNPELNKANAQLLFTSHDTNLLDPNVLRRDQIYFTEKSLQEATILYSLADLKGIRNNADFARQYLAGLYGALPVLGDYVTAEKTPA